MHDISLPQYFCVRIRLLFHTSRTSISSTISTEHSVFDCIIFPIASLQYEQQVRYRINNINKLAKSANNGVGVVDYDSFVSRKGGEHSSVGFVAIFSTF